MYSEICEKHIQKGTKAPMRVSIQPQMPLVQSHFKHEHTLELQAISEIIDEEKENRKRRKQQAASGYKKVEKDW